MAAIAVDGSAIGPLPIEGPRLTLRPFELGEAASVARLLIDFDVVRFAGEIPWPYDPKQAAAFIALSHQHFARGRDSIFAAERRSDSALVGCVALHANANGRTARLGYWFGQAFWGQGYATETIGLALAFGFSERALDGIEAEAHVANVASWKALERAGLVFEGIVDLTFRSRGFVAPARRYAMSRDQWRHQQ
jgi:RimJ/RimL family protein N-acetyltransferase